MIEEGKSLVKAKNCWEFIQCQVRDKCPAHPDKGKFCWLVEGTLCNGQKQGTFHEKIAVCQQCSYYQYRR